MTGSRDRAIELEARAAVVKRRWEIFVRSLLAFAVLGILAGTVVSTVTLLTIRHAQVSHEQTITAIAAVQRDLDHKFVLVITSACHAQPNSKACAKLLTQIKEKS